MTEQEIRDLSERFYASNRDIDRLERENAELLEKLSDARLAIQTIKKITECTEELHEQTKTRLAAAEAEITQFKDTYQHRDRMIDELFTEYCFCGHLPMEHEPDCVYCECKAYSAKTEVKA